VEQLLNRLSNLSYEVLGILLPGLIALIMFVLWLVGLGELVPFVSGGFFPRVTLSSAAAALESIGVRTGLGIAGPLLLVTYFLGHLLHWISRSGSSDDAIVASDWKRTWRSLLFGVPKPSVSFDQNLQPLYESVLPKFSLTTKSTWSQFYPVARSFLRCRLESSLTALYQNKYTLHRSITASAALFFWLSIGGLIVGLVAASFSRVEPRWVALLAFAYGCVILVWGFSASYAYNWRLFGNTVVTETFALLKGPQDVKS
jgi:hypothetical protein